MLILPEDPTNGFFDPRAQRWPHADPTTSTATALELHSSPVGVDLDRGIEGARRLLEVDLGAPHLPALVHDDPAKKGGDSQTHACVEGEGHTRATIKGIATPEGRATTTNSCGKVGRRKRKGRDLTVRRCCSTRPDHIYVTT